MAEIAFHKREIPRVSLNKSFPESKELFWITFQLSTDEITFFFDTEEEVTQFFQAVKEAEDA